MSDSAIGVSVMVAFVLGIVVMRTIADLVQRQRQRAEDADRADRIAQCRELRRGQFRG